jgi:hypothetical protein
LRHAPHPPSLCNLALIGLAENLIKPGGLDARQKVADLHRRQHRKPKSPSGFSDNLDGFACAYPNSRIFDSCYLGLTILGFSILLWQ